MRSGKVGCVICARVLEWATKKINSKYMYNRTGLVTQRSIRTRPDPMAGCYLDDP